MDPGLAHHGICSNWHCGCIWGEPQKITIKWVNAQAKYKHSPELRQWPWEQTGGNYIKIYKHSADSETDGGVWGSVRSMTLLLSGVIHKRWWSWSPDAGSTVPRRASPSLCPILYSVSLKTFRPCWACFFIFVFLWLVSSEMKWTLKIVNQI